jgi:hypothetical protein
MKEKPINWDDILNETIQEKESEQNTVINKLYDLRNFLQQLHKKYLPPSTEAKVKALLVDGAEGDRSSFSFYFTELFATETNSQTENDYFDSKFRSAAEGMHEKRMVDHFKKAKALLIGELGLQDENDIPETLISDIQEQIADMYSKMRIKVGHNGIIANNKCTTFLGENDNESKELPNPDDVALSIGASGVRGQLIYIPKKYFIETDLETIKEEIEKIISKFSLKDLLPPWKK